MRVIDDVPLIMALATYRRESMRRHFRGDSLVVGRRGNRVASAAAQKDGHLQKPRTRFVPSKRVGGTIFVAT